MITIIKLDRKDKVVFYKPDSRLTSELVTPIYWANGKWKCTNPINSNRELDKLLENYTQFDPAVEVIHTNPDLLNKKQERYILDPKNNKDLIDKWSEKYNQQDFGLIIWAMIEKYQTRLGRKDSIVSELTKMQDYMTRWLEVEKIRLQEKLNDSNS